MTKFLVEGSVSNSIAKVSKSRPPNLFKSSLVLKKPSGISVQDGKRPDGCTLTPWRAGKCLAWDVTVPGTLAECYVHLTSKECGLAAIRKFPKPIFKICVKKNYKGEIGPKFAAIVVSSHTVT
ncbi:hypothetical protein HELRODRAFT_174324 [Helobdella robusta]|uniref:Uncharacterized protein n=1 Tax=Helobdella robusta TaxID=6412 RepID=T1F803_HELRO|nr:hypothetical protein HELRODRAFT_174324 [Helobdella robusta]ESO02882.1 hypothetical protein HELRODRAFT_174324 [Helobdella robusta]